MCWLAGLLYGGSELGSATALPAAGDKPQPYNVLFRLKTKSQLEEVIKSGQFRTNDESGFRYYGSLPCSFQ